MKRMWFVVCGLSIAMFVGCEKAASTGSSASASAEALPADLFVSAAPAGALDVGAAKKSLKDGQSVVVKARIGGQAEPLAPGRAIMTISDLTMPGCDKIPGDTCKTPWDSCCEPKDVIAANSLTVQVSDKEGRPLKANLTGAGGLAPGKHVVIAGTAKSVPGSDSFLIDAKQIHVAQ